MPRASRYILPGQTVHITQRCHNRSFLLKFAKDRTRYVDMLRERLEEHAIDLFTYCITSNHVHLLLRDREAGGETSSIPAFMNSLAGDFAQAYNLRKRRSGSFWGDRYHASMIDDREYLFRCLRYIDMNMVRAGAVAHPSEWLWTGYNELVGVRKRYRLINRERLLLHLCSDGRRFTENYIIAIDEAVRRREHERESCWTENLAVGSEAWCKHIAPRIPLRMRTEVVDQQAATVGHVIRETTAAYG